MRRGRRGGYQGDGGYGASVAGDLAEHTAAQATAVRHRPSTACKQEPCLYMIERWRRRRRGGGLARPRRIDSNTAACAWRNQGSQPTQRRPAGGDGQDGDGAVKRARQHQVPLPTATMPCHASARRRLIGCPRTKMQGQGRGDGWRATYTQADAGEAFAWRSHLIHRQKLRAPPCHVHALSGTCAPSDKHAILHSRHRTGGGRLPHRDACQHTRHASPCEWRHRVQASQRTSRGRQRAGEGR